MGEDARDPPQALFLIKKNREKVKKFMVVTFLIWDI